MWILYRLTIRLGISLMSMLKSRALRKLRRSLISHTTLTRTQQITSVLNRKLRWPSKEAVKSFGILLLLKIVAIFTSKPANTKKPLNATGSASKRLKNSQTARTFNNWNALSCQTELWHIWNLVNLNLPMKTAAFQLISTVNTWSHTWEEQLL